MKCPNCKSNIIDSAIICPVCNTQFAFAAPSSFNPQDTNLYEEVEVLDDNSSLNVEVNPNSVTALPTEIDRAGEEEIDPNAQSFTVVPETQGEFMHINGQPIAVDDTPYNPLETFSQVPIRTEAPRTNMTPNQNQQVVSVGNNVSLTNVVPEQPVVVNNIINKDNSHEVVNDALKEQTELVPPIAPVTVGVMDETYKQELEKTRKMSDIFFKVVICVGLPIFIGLVAILFLGENPNSKGKKLETIKTTTLPVIAVSSNTGHKSSFNYPMYPGNTTLASIYDAGAKRYTDVDVKGERFITGVEANELAKNYAGEALIEGFEWLGFEYTVTFNDLTYLEKGNLSPILRAVIYKWNGFDFITHNGKNHFLKLTSIYDGGNITNGSSAKIKLIFQIPIGEKDYSLCFGYLEQTMGCFRK